MSHSAAPLSRCVCTLWLVSPIAGCGLDNEMAARHRARRTTIQIISTKRLEAKECVRPLTKQFIDSKIRFPLVHRAPRVPTKEFRSPFKANRPSTLF